MQPTALPDVTAGARRDARRAPKRRSVTLTDEFGRFRGRPFSLDPHTMPPAFVEDASGHALSRRGAVAWELTG